jgi:hypothetical protein
MKHETTKTVATLAGLFGSGILIGALAALLGILAMGCDGGGADLPDAGDLPDGGADAQPRMDATPKTDVVPRTDAVAGLGRSDAGMVYCTISSPTGDAVNKSSGRTAREDAMMAAESLAYMAFIVVAKDSYGQGGDPRQTCLDAVAAGLATDASCDSPSTDFRGPGGTRHCFGLAGSLPDELRCSPNLTGTRTCSLAPGMGVLDDGASTPRRWALCSSSGSFVGWGCN